MNCQGRDGEQQAPILFPSSLPKASSLLDSDEGRRIHFAVMAIESGARKMGVDGRQMHDRLKAQDLIHKRLLGRYETLHTQSREFVANDIVETLRNWEADT